MMGHPLPIFQPTLWYKRLQFANLNMAIEIVSFTIKHGDFPSFFVCLPEMVNIPK